MAITQISQVQVRRGLNEDLPQLASGEMGWSIDTRQLYIGNGSLTEGAPTTGVTEILTQYSDLLSVGTTYTFKGLSSGEVVVTGPDALHPIVRSLQDKLDDYVSVKDFGAIGDGSADDTAAIQRALSNVYGTAQNVLLTYHHRTIYFPAGQYRITGTINVPPYTRIQGEGKRSTIIIGTFDGPLVQFADGYGQVGINYGAPNAAGIDPENAEYHFNDLSFFQNSPNLNQSCVLIDGCFTATFTRCMFRGLLSSTSGDYGGSLATNNPIYNVDRGAGIAGVQISNNSAYVAVRNVIFTACDFLEINYGLELNGETKGIMCNNCYFDRMYHYVVAGNASSGSYYPLGITLSQNYFRFAAAEGIVVATGVVQLSSLGNFYTGWGLQDWESNTNVINTTGTAAYPAISFNDSYNYSIGDMFELDTVSTVPLVKDNGYTNFVIDQNTGIRNGRKTTGIGKMITLANASSFTNTNVSSAPMQYSNLTMDYSILHASSRRIGTLTVANVGGVYAYTEDFTETGSTGVVFRANSTNGNIEYTSTSNGNAAILTYTLNYFTSSI